MVVHQVIDASLDVLHAIDPQLAVIQIDKFLAKARRSAHVRSKHANPLCQQRLIIAAKWRALLPFWAAMKTNDVWSWSILVFGFVEPAAQLQSIKRFESNQLRPDESRQINSGMWTECKLAELFGLHVHDPYVSRLCRTGNHRSRSLFVEI